MALGRHAQDAGGAYGVVSLRTPEVSSSLEPLHLHIVSQDFESECLKNKKHYLTFATPLFVEASQMEAWLDTGGARHGQGAFELGPDRHAYWAGLEKGDLICDGRVFANVPKLKEHLARRASQARQAAGGGTS